MNRQTLLDWCGQRYGTEPDYPWHDQNVVLRHRDNRKWYGVILAVEASKLGITGSGVVDVLNVKGDPILIGTLRMQPGFYPAYHMNKEKWVSILLDGPVVDDVIKQLMEFSYQTTGPRKK